jgi:enediyne biosynthesis protein E4
VRSEPNNTVMRCWIAIAISTAGALCLCAQMAKPTAPQPAALRLVDIVRSTGIHFRHLHSPDKKYIVDSMGGGLALIDYDGDGWQDIYFTDSPDVDLASGPVQARSVLYHNDHNGRFTDVTDKAGVGHPCWANGAVVGDYNNDGRPDLLVTCFGGLVLYGNNGDGTFSDVTKGAGLGADKLWAMGAAFGDYDGDGLLDIFISHYAAYDLRDLPAFGSMVNCQYHGIRVQCGPAGLKGSPDSLYHNDGNGHFSDTSKQAGVDDPDGLLGLTAVWSDFNNNGRPDLFVANDGAQNYLYRNDGAGRFTEVSYRAGVALDENGKALANMGLALGDYLHTGHISVAISHFSEQYFALFQNNGGLNFTDVSNVSRIARATTHYVGWGDAFYDPDNDGWLDLILANGHVYPQVDAAKIGISYREPTLLFVNQRDGSFRDVSMQAGTALTIPRVGRGLAVGDLFNDGIQEVVIEDLDGEPVILRPESPVHNHWIEFQLRGTTSNKLALNARIRLTAGDLTQTEEVRSSGSYLSQSDLRPHFGLGERRKADRIEILWPSGRKEPLFNIEADRVHCVTEGSGLVPCGAPPP